MQLGMQRFRGVLSRNVRIFETSYTPSELTICHADDVFLTRKIMPKFGDEIPDVSLHALRDFRYSNIRCRNN